MGWNFILCVQQSNLSIFRWCGRNFVLRYAHYDAMFVLFYDPNIQEHPVEYSKIVSIDAPQLTLKNSIQVPSFQSFVTSSFAHRCLQSLLSVGSA